MIPIEGYFLANRLLMRLLADHHQIDRYVLIVMNKEDKRILQNDLKSLINLHATTLGL
jgi:hypothetical protein